MKDKELARLADYEVDQKAESEGYKMDRVIVKGNIDDAIKNETFECDNHGAIPVTYGIDGRIALAKMSGRKFEPQYIKTFKCSKCVDEARERITTEREDARGRIEKDRVDDLKVSVGMSPRNLDVTFNDFKVSNDKQAKALETAKRICSMIKNKERKVPNMIITGSVGTGKSMLASAMINDVFGSGTIAMSTIIKIMREIKGTWKRDSEMDEQKLLDWYISRDILVIDEVGVQFDSDTEKLFIFDLIDGRYQHMRPTIIISNLDINGIKACIGERCYDRLKEDGGKLIGLDFESQRGKK